MNLTIDWTFTAWVGLMVVAIAYFFLAAKRSRYIHRHAEDVASQALPEIGGIAEKQHHERFGRAPTHSSDTWYPPLKKKRHA